LTAAYFKYSDWANVAISWNPWTCEHWNAWTYSIKISCWVPN